MDFGMQVVGPYDHVLDIARVCERQGAVAIAFADHYLYGNNAERYASAPAYDSLVQAAALGRDTSDLEIVMLVSPITFRHPAVYAKASITIDELSGGRFVLGLGTGWHDDEHGYLGIPYPDRNERFHMLEDALGYLHAFFTDPAAGFSSHRYSFTGVEYQPPARPGLRILVGGGGPQRTPRLAGTYAGEYSLAGAEPGDLAEKIAVMKEAAVAAARDPDSILISASTVMIGGDSDAEITENIGRIDDRPGKDARAAWEEFGLVFRTWEEYRDRIGRYEEAGVDRIYLQLVTRDADFSAETLEQLGRT